jgi:hypothetical protein
MMRAKPKTNQINIFLPPKGPNGVYEELSILVAGSRPPPVRVGLFLMGLDAIGLKKNSIIGYSSPNCDSSVHQEEQWKAAGRMRLQYWHFQYNVCVFEIGISCIHFLDCLKRVIGVALCWIEHAGR